MNLERPNFGGCNLKYSFENVSHLIRRAVRGLPAMLINNNNFRLKDPHHDCRQNLAQHFRRISAPSLGDLMRPAAGCAQPYFSPSPRESFIFVLNLEMW